MSVQFVDALDDLDLNDTDLDAVLVREDKPAPVTTPTVDAAAIAKQVKDELLAALPRPQVVPMQQVQRESAVAKEYDRLVKQGVNPVAIKEIMGIAAALQADTNAAAAEQAMVQNTKNFSAACYQIGMDEVSAIMAGIPSLKDEDAHITRALVERVSDEIARNSEYAHVKSQIAAGHLPDRREVAKVAAKVIDKHLEKSGMSKQAQSPAIKPGKPAAAVDGAASFDIQDLSKEARKLYNLNKKYTGDEKRARQIAMEYDKGA